MTTEEVQAAIANANPALVFKVEKESLLDELWEIQKRLYGLQSVSRCLQSALSPDRILDIEESLTTVCFELATLADKTEMAWGRLDRLGNTPT
ncbi:hypothetical protein IQ218_17430 [Synechocystis salina LEGE 06099]|nr:hypothetical protein [Synechocystis salina LEGE 06099]